MHIYYKPTSGTGVTDTSSVPNDCSAIAFSLGGAEVCVMVMEGERCVIGEGDGGGTHTPPTPLTTNCNSEYQQSTHV